MLKNGSFRLVRNSGFSFQSPILRRKGRGKGRGRKGDLRKRRRTQKRRRRKRKIALVLITLCRSRSPTKRFSTDSRWNVKLILAAFVAKHHYIIIPWPLPFFFYVFLNVCVSDKTGGGGNPGWGVGEGPSTRQSPDSCWDAPHHAARHTLVHTGADRHVRTPNPRL